MANNTCAMPPELYQGDNTTKDFSFSFPYIKKEDIVVFLWDDKTNEYQICTDVGNVNSCSTNPVSPTEYYFKSAVEISFCQAPGLPDPDRTNTFSNVIIGRLVDICAMIAYFYPGTSIRAQDLNNNFNQILLALQDVESKVYIALGELTIVVEQIEGLIRADAMQDAPYPVWDDKSIGTAGADVRYFSTLVQTSTPNSSYHYEVGKTWFKNDDDGQLFIWDGTKWDRIARDAAYKEVIDLNEQRTGEPVSDDSIFTSAASAERFDTFVQKGTPSRTDYEVGKTWLKNDDDGQLFIWDGSSWDRIGRDAAYKEVIDLAEQRAGEPVSDDSIFTSSASAERFDTFVQTDTPLRTDYEVGKTWLQNDVDKTLSVWDGKSWVGVASGGTFTTQPTTIYVDSVNGNDTNDGHRIINPMRTIKAAVAQANTVTSEVTTNVVSATYDNLTGLATFVTSGSHGCYVGTELTMTPQTWSCDNGQLTFPEAGDPKRFVTKLLSPTSFEVQMEPSTKVHTYVSGGTITGQKGFLGDGWIIICAPGVYQEQAPISIQARNLSIVGASIRSTFIHPTTATQYETLFLADSGFYLTQFTIAGIKASGTRGNSTVDPDPTTGLPETQGWVVGFRPGCIIRKSPYIQNCTNFSDESIDNDNFDPNNLQGEAGDVGSGPTGGGIICDGAVPAIESPLRSFVVDAFTQIALAGPGILCTNNGYAQLVSFFGTFCWYHAKARNGGQLNLSNCTTDFGEYGLIADGKSVDPVVIGSVSGNYPANVSGPVNTKTELVITGLTAQSNFKSNQPGPTQVVTIGSQTYMVYKSTKVVNGECTITLLNPNPAQRNQDLGLIDAINNGETAEFRLQSYISTGGHTFEFVGSGTDYRAHPDYGGQAIEANQYLEVGGTGTNSKFNGGKVWLSATDEEGNFKVGDAFEVDQKTGFVTIDPTSVSINLIADQTPDLGGDLDVNGYKIVGDRNGNDGDIVLEVNSNSTIDLETTSAVKIPVGTEAQRPTSPETGMIRFNTEEEEYEGWNGKEWDALGGLDPALIGTSPEQIPVNGYLGKQAFVDEVGTVRPYFASSGFYSAPQTGGDIQFRYVSDTSIQLVMKGLDGTIRSTTLTLS